VCIAKNYKQFVCTQRDLILSPRQNCLDCFSQAVTVRGRHFQNRVQRQTLTCGCTARCGLPIGLRSKNDPRPNRRTAQPGRKKNVRHIPRRCVQAKIAQALQHTRILPHRSFSYRLQPHERNCADRAPVRSISSQFSPYSSNCLHFASHSPTHTTPSYMLKSRLYSLPKLRDPVPAPFIAHGYSACQMGTVQTATHFQGPCMQTMATCWAWLHFKSADLDTRLICFSVAVRMQSLAPAH
jgi:hypothetical protein